MRLSSRPIDQALAALPEGPEARERRRQAVLAGGYRLRQCQGRPMACLVGMGAVMPEVLAAADALAEGGVGCDVICLTSADLVFRAVQARRGLAGGPADVLGSLFPVARSAPLVAVLDGHPHTLSFLGAINSAPITCLGVSGFGQCGEIGDLYRHFGIDTPTIIGAVWDLLDEVGCPEGLIVLEVRRCNNLPNQRTRGSKKMAELVPSDESAKATESTRILPDLNRPQSMLAGGATAVARRPGTAGRDRPQAARAGVEQEDR